MGRLLNELNPRFLPLAAMLLAKLTEQKIPCIIVCTGRTQLEQDIAYQTGKSRVKYSRHQEGFAIDIVPYEIYHRDGISKLDWNTNDPIWLEIGRIGEELGLRWGGRFHPLNNIGIGWDPGHFEMLKENV